MSVNVRLVCQHISCNAPCKELVVELTEEEFEKRKAQARAMSPLDNRPLMTYKCKVSGSQIFEMVIVNDKIIEAQRSSTQTRLSNLKAKLKQSRVDFIKQEKELEKEIAALEEDVKRNK